MKKLLFFFIILSNNLFAQINLSHNIGNTPIKTDWVNCEEEQSWARVFNLEDFGITTDEQFIIKSGKTAISNAKLGSGIEMSISIIDENFPNSNIIHNNGSYRQTPEIGDIPEILSFEFSSHVVIPAGVKRILVTVSQSSVTSISETPFLIAGTAQDKDVSWFSGCGKHYTYIKTENLEDPKPNANFFINVTGEKINTINSDENINLTHNIGDNVLKTNMFSCSSSSHFWARKFVLKDFEINDNEELIIEKGQIGFSETGWLSSVQFNIYKIDSAFPASFSESDLIGSSQVQTVPAFSKIGLTAKITLVEFETPITVPSEVEMILVEVKKGIVYGDGLAFIAGTENDNDDSWYRGCNGHSSGEYRTTSELWPSPTSNINFYITVNGKAKTIFPFQITNDNNCENKINNFSLTNQTEMKSVIWNFDDPSSGVNNTSTSIDVSHQFSNPGIYNVTATVVHVDNTSYTIPKKIEIFEAPNVNPIVELKQCDNSGINGFSFFNLNEVKEEIITNSNDYTITFYEEKIDAENNRTAITNVTNYKNEIVSVDKIWARVENNDDCYNISEVNLFVSTTQIPSTLLNSFYQCDDGTNTTDGIATFDFSTVTNDIVNVFPVGQQLIINYYRNEDDALSEENAITDITNYQNIGYPNQQNIYIRVDSKFDNDCLGLGAHISLNVEKVPVANLVTINPECDNDRDGFYSFDTSTIQNIIIGSQTDVTVNYFDENGTQLSSPLPNPFITESQTITAKIVNALSNDLDGQCSDETIFNFIVNSVPIANIVVPQEVCDTDLDGVFGFDTSAIENTVLGSQAGLIVRYFDKNNTELQSPLPNPFFTASQIITVRLENPIYEVCFEETTIDFIVREKPTFNLIEEDIICMSTNPSLVVSVENASGNFSYTWKDENNQTISSDDSANIKKGGTYKVLATSIYGCESVEHMLTIKESSISSININDVLVQDDSDNNYIKVKTSNLGLGDYEFRLLDLNSKVIYDYQSDPNFENLEGGIYILEVNDKNNCGAIPFEISLISFPSFFTPNSDGENDFWQIKGLDNSYYKNGIITVFNRYGKQVATFSINDVGWDGTYNGKNLPQNDYWFQVVLINQSNEVKNRSGNFSLLRK
jgi:gliding motility-associated-like protein